MSDHQTRTALPSRRDLLIAAPLLAASASAAASQFNDAKGMTIGAGITQIMTDGHSTAGNGGAIYVSDAAVDAAFVTANPRWSFIAADGRGFRLSEASPDITMFGAVGDDVTDCYAAIVACLAYMSRFFITNMNWPDGKFYCSGTIQLKQQVIISGPSAGQEPGVTGTDTNYLRFPADKAGIVLNRYNMLDGAIVAGGGRADASILRGLHLRGGGGTPADSSSGIRSNVRVKIEDCLIHGFAGHGIFIKGNGGGNANCWRIDTVRLWGNGKSGLRVTGADGNAGISTMVDASNNGEWGIHDDSFLGNKHDGFHMEFNKLGPWKTDGANGFFWMDGYTEPGQPNASASPNTIWSGPQFVAVDGAGSGLRANGLDGGGLGSTNGHYARRIHPSGKFLRSRIGVDPANGQFIAFECNDEIGSLSLLTDLIDFFWNMNGISPMRITSAATRQQFGTGRAVPGVVNLNDLYLGAGGEARRQTYASQAPTSGAHAKGEVVWNNGDHSRDDAVDYWRCIAGGTPGRWVARP